MIDASKLALPLHLCVAARLSGVGVDVVVLEVADLGSGAADRSSAELSVSQATVVQGTAGKEGSRSP